MEQYWCRRPTFGNPEFQNSWLTPWSIQAAVVRLATLKPTVLIQRIIATTSTPSLDYPTQDKTPHIERDSRLLWWGRVWAATYDESDNIEEHARSYVNATLSLIIHHRPPSFSITPCMKKWGKVFLPALACSPVPG